MVTATNGSTLSFQPLVLVEQKVKVSLPSASNSLLTDCIALVPVPEISKLTFPYKLLLSSGLACAPCHACPGAACWETARGVLTAPTPTTTTTRAIQSRVWKRL